MNKYIYLFLVIFGLLSNEIKAEDTKMILIRTWKRRN